MVCAAKGTVMLRPMTAEKERRRPSPFIEKAIMFSGISTMKKPTCCAMTPNVHALNP